MATNKSTQKFLPIKEIRDGVIVLKDGSIRAVLLASSLNFALKSQDEQASVLAQFQNFLNSLDFSIQFLIQSRKLDIRPYTELLESRYQDSKNSELMKLQIKEYIQFIKEFTETSNIMTKSFFVVVGYNPPIIDSSKGILGQLMNRRNKKDIGSQENKFREDQSQLEQRVAVVRQGLVRSGVRAAQLGTEELVELFFKMFNPGEREKPASIGK